MIGLLSGSALILAALQASIAAPTSTFRSCLHDAATKATTEKVGTDAIDTYLRSACTVQMGTLKSALVAFRLKNGMAQKAASKDAQMTIDDYVSTPVDNYKFMAERNAPKPSTAVAATPAAAAAPAQTASSQQPKP